MPPIPISDELIQQRFLHVVEEVQSQSTKPGTTIFSVLLFVFGMVFEPTRQEQYSRGLTPDEKESLVAMCGGWIEWVEKQVHMWRDLGNLKFRSCRSCWFRSCRSCRSC